MATSYVIVIAGTLDPAIHLLTKSCEEDGRACQARGGRCGDSLGVPGQHMDAQVRIVGAGPTGLTLAIDLGLRGGRAVVIEQKEAPQFLPKMERCNARTMEIYRRMGIVEEVRAAGLPAHCPMDIFVVLSLAEPA